MGRPLRDLLNSLAAVNAGAYRAEPWRPSVDIYRAENGWLIKFDLAGVRSQDIRLAVSGSTLVVSGVRRDLAVCEGSKAYSMEISYNQFERSIELPCEIDAAHIQSDYRDGMFLISVELRRDES